MGPSPIWPRTSYLLLEPPWRLFYCNYFSSCVIGLLHLGGQTHTRVCTCVCLAPRMEDCISRPTPSFLIFVRTFSPYSLWEQRICSFERVITVASVISIVSQALNLSLDIFLLQCQRIHPVVHERRNCPIFLFRCLRQKSRPLELRPFFLSPRSGRSDATFEYSSVMTQCSGQTKY